MRTLVFSDLQNKNRDFSDIGQQNVLTLGCAKSAKNLVGRNGWRLWLMPLRSADLEAR